MVFVIVGGIGAVLLGTAMVRWHSTFDKYLTTRFASTRVMGWFFIAGGVGSILSGIFVDQTP